jgi:hypothetical protein
MSRKEVTQSRDALRRKAVSALTSAIGDAINDQDEMYEYTNYMMCTHGSEDLRRAHHIYIHTYQDNNEPTADMVTFMDYFIDTWYQPGIDYDPHQMAGSYNSDTEQYEPTFEDAYMHHYMRIYNRVVEQVLRQTFTWYNAHNNTSDFNMDMAARLELMGESLMDRDTEAVIRAMEFYVLARLYKE